jgi:uncharacterized protein YigE (DUF2233 family)
MSVSQATPCGYSTNTLFSFPTMPRSILTFLLALSLAPTAQAWTVAAREPVVAMASGAELHHINITAGDAAVDLDLVTFSSKKCTLRILDQPHESTALGLAAALRGAGALAGTNGGFFDPQFQPLGLYIVDGQRSGVLSRSSLLGGILLLRQGKLQILWRDEYKDAPGTTQLLQTGPRLVNAGQAITGLDAKASRPRSFILTDNAGHWAVGTAHYCSLAQLADILATPGLLPELQVQRALNCDGGRSTGMWAQQADGQAFYQSTMVTVRNYIAILPKQAVKPKP